MGRGPGGVPGNPPHSKLRLRGCAGLGPALGIPGAGAEVLGTPRRPLSRCGGDAVRSATGGEGLSSDGPGSPRLSPVCRGSRSLAEIWSEDLCPAPHKATP